MSRSWRQVFSLILIFKSVASLQNNHHSNEIMEITFDDLDNFFSGYFNTDDSNFVLLLDYDGTLAPIASHPNLTAMTDSTTAVLESISKNPKIFTAVISGRGVFDAKRKVNIENLIYAGNHGLEILYPNGTRYNHEIPGNVGENFEKIVKALEKIARNGSWIENKKVSLTFHYRAMPEDEHEAIKNEAKSIIESHGYRANQAHCAVEAKPPVLWNKGKAAEYIISHTFGNDWTSNVKVVFLGDDTTDEDVFQLLQGTGVTFRVTKDPNLTTFATHKIPSTESVTKILQWIDKKFK